MKKKATRPRVHVELTAFSGNDDVESRIKVSRRRWHEIQDGAEYLISAWSWYEGRRSRVSWSFADGKVSICGEDGMQSVVQLPVENLYSRTTTSG